MSKAAERALEKYPLMSNDDKEGLEALKYIGMKCECVSVFNEAQEAKQAFFIEGYQQAEKDLANVREETIKEVCEWLDSHTILSEKWYIEDLKKHFS